MPNSAAALSENVPLELRFTATREGGPALATFAGVAGRHGTLPLALRREYYEQGHSTGEHVHLDFLALYAVRGGQAVHRINGAPYGVARGDVYLMPSGATHEYCDYQNLVIDAFYFPTALFVDAEIEALRSHPGFWALFAGEAATQKGVEHRLHLAPEAWQSVADEIEALRHEWQQDSAAAPLLLRAGVFRLLVHLARRFEAESGPELPRRYAPLPTMAEAIRFCEAHFAEDLSVPQLAARLFLSPGHFSSLFVQATGMPPAAYIRCLRLEKARALLREGQLSATQVALQTGFGDPAHFSRAFRAAYGVSPSRYRRRVDK